MVGRSIALSSSKIKIQYTFSLALRGEKKDVIIMNNCSLDDIYKNLE